MTQCICANVQEWNYTVLTVADPLTTVLGFVQTVCVMQTENVKVSINPLPCALIQWLLREVLSCHWNTFLNRYIVCIV